MFLPNSSLSYSQHTTQSSWIDISLQNTCSNPFCKSFRNIRKLNCRIDFSFTSNVNTANHWIRNQNSICYLEYPCYPVLVMHPGILRISYGYASGDWWLNGPEYFESRIKSLHLCSICVLSLRQVLKHLNSMAQRCIEITKH